MIVVFVHSPSVLCVVSIMPSVLCSTVCVHCLPCSDLDAKREVKYEEVRVCVRA